MRQWLVTLTESAIVFLDFMALLVIIFGTAEAIIRGLHLTVTRTPGMESRDVWLRYARWLVAALTFQLAADIIETSITTSWEAVARIAAVAVIRTFLDICLERDVETRVRRGETGAIERDEAARTTPR